MDGSTFDRLTRAVSTAGSRRGVLGVLASVGLGGLLTRLDDDESAAKRKRHGRRNSHRPGKDKDNRKGKRKKKRKGGGSGLGGDQCGSTGSDCTQDSDCCSNNCFNFACAAKVTQCSEGGTTTPCRPPANGCAGNQCCHGALACDDGCCQGSANQCNPQGNCCTPNCNGRQCGDDGCGNGETCGSCPTGQTCNAQNGKCQGASTCSAQTCPFGCCDANGMCQEGTSAQACGGGGAACQACATGLCALETRTCVTCIPDGEETCTHESDCCVADVICCDGRCCPAGRTCCLGQACCDGPCCPPGSVSSCCGSGSICCPAGSASDCCDATSKCCASDADCPGAGQSCSDGCCGE